MRAQPFHADSRDENNSCFTEDFAKAPKCIALAD